MRASSSTSWLRIAFSLLLALMLGLLPVPHWMQWIEPGWVLLALMYWAIAEPSRVGLGIVWLVGLIMDLVTDTAIGQHTFPLLVTLYLLSNLRDRFHVFPVSQQIFVIGLLSSCYYGVQYWIIHLTHSGVVRWLGILPIFSSLFAWMLMSPFLKKYHRHLRSW